jgi:hypothetical protein
MEARLKRDSSRTANDFITFQSSTFGVANKMGLILIRTLAEYLLRDICLSSKRPNGQTNPEAHRLMHISDRDRTRE